MGLLSLVARTSKMTRKVGRHCRKCLLGIESWLLQSGSQSRKLLFDAVNVKQAAALNVPGLTASLHFAERFASCKGRVRYIIMRGLYEDERSQ